MISQFIVSDENYNDLYITKKGYKAEDIENFIKKHKKENFGTWNLSTLQADIEKNFEVDRVIHCDIVYNLEEI